jgi:hypothetical protein
MNEEVLKTLLTPEQLEALETIAKRFNTKIDLKKVYIGGAGLIPNDWIICDIGKLTVGISPQGNIHS